MRIRKITTVLLVASALTAAPISAEEIDDTTKATDRPAEGQKRDHGQKPQSFENMSDEEKQARRARYENMSDEEKQAMRERRHTLSRERRAKIREGWESMSDEERQAAREKMKNRPVDKGGRHGRPDRPGENEI